MQKRNNGVINAVKIMGCPLRQPIFTEARSGIVDYESGLQPLTPPQTLPLTPAITLVERLRRLGFS